MRMTPRISRKMRAAIMSALLATSVLPLSMATTPAHASHLGPWDYYDDFSLTPPASHPWHYMYESETTYTPSLFQELTTTSSGNCNNGSVGYWATSDGSVPHVGANQGSTQAQCSSSGFLSAETGYVHPGPSELAVIGWKSPFTGSVKVEGHVGDSDSGGGDGVDWKLMNGSTVLDSGTVLNGGTDQPFDEATSITENSFLYLAIGPRGDYSFDMTDFSFTITAAPHSFDVNSTDDQSDATPGDQVCATGDLLTGDVPECSLRAAVMEANALPGTQTINVPAGTYTLTAGGGNDGGSDPSPDGSGGDLDVTDDVVIDGAGQAQTIVQAGTSPFTGIDRVIEFWGDNDSTVQDLTIRNGNPGSGLYVDLGGLVRNNAPADVTLDGVTVTGGHASCTGGGIFNWHNAGRASGATMTILNSTVIGNRSAGACAARGGGISNEGGAASVLSVQNSTISDNLGGDGGGVSSDGSLILMSTTISGNTASAGNGGVRQYGAETTITNSSFTNNCAGTRGTGGTCQPGAFGGALALGGTTSSLTGVTITGNGATEGAGLFINGGTHTVTDADISQNSGLSAVLHGDGSGTFTLKKSAITENTASSYAIRLAANRSHSSPLSVLENVTTSGNSNGGIYAAQNSTFTNVTVADNGGTGFYANRWYWGDTVSFTNVLLADNTTSDCVSENGGGSGPNLATGGGNLIENGTCPFTGDTSTHQSGVDPDLEALSGSGSARTHALASDSEAIDAGVNGGCPATDQRSVARPQDGPDGDTTATCDIGAYEFELPPDPDGDGVPNASDNCPDVANAGQADGDGDGVGDVCDADDNDGPLGDLDDDGTNNQNDPDDADPCVPSDTVAECDSDADTVPDGEDNCPDNANADQADADGDGLGDVCDADDNDGPLGDLDDDGTNNQNDPDDADPCVPSDTVAECDSDADTVPDGEDNCISISNPGQKDADGDGIGNPCDTDDNDGPLGDLDEDGVANENDACPTTRGSGADGCPGAGGSQPGPIASPSPSPEPSPSESGQPGEPEGDFEPCLADPDELCVVEGVIEYEGTFDNQIVRINRGSGGTITGNGNEIHIDAGATHLLQVSGNGNTIYCTAPCSELTLQLVGDDNTLVIVTPVAATARVASVEGMTVTIEGSDNQVVGGPGADAVSVTGFRNEVRGGGGPDVITITEGSDNVLRGGIGDDELRSASGSDLLRGGSGADLLYGRAGDDTLKGGSGADELRGGKGNDTLRGGRGPDFIRGGDGSDSCKGGTKRACE